MVKNDPPQGVKMTLPRAEIVMGGRENFSDNNKGFEICHFGPKIIDPSKLLCREIIDPTRTEGGMFHFPMFSFEIL